MAPFSMLQDASLLSFQPVEKRRETRLDCRLRLQDEREQERGKAKQIHHEGRL
jgi:hypothetical protein